MDSIASRAYIKVQSTEMLKEIVERCDIEDSDCEGCQLFNCHPCYTAALAEIRSREVDADFIPCLRAKEEQKALFEGYADELE